MHTEALQVDNVALLRVSGRFDANEAAQVEQWLKGVSATAPACALVNLRDVHFIDSTGLATLIQGMKQCRKQQGDVILCCLQQPVRIIVELTRLDRVFAIYDTEEEAVGGFPHVESQHSVIS